VPETPTGRAADSRPGGPAARAENGLATLVAIGLMALPLANVLAARWLGRGVTGAGLFAQHLTLWLGLLGGAIAARDGKLLSLATATLLPEGRLRRASGIVTGGAGAAVATLFAVGGLTLTQFDREFASEIAAGVPTWVADLVLPIGFALIALRLVWRAAPGWRGRTAASLGPMAGLVVAWQPGWLEGQAAWPWLAVIVGVGILGAPIFVVLGGAAMLLVLVDGRPLVVPLVNAYQQLTSTALPTLPLFTLAGFLLAEGQASARLLRLFRAFFGWLPGGTAIVTAALCAFFTSFTGGSGVTILALGGLLLPALVADGYRNRFSVGLITASGSLGLLFPPSMPLILYAIIASNANLEDLFIGGLLPGVVMLGLVALWGAREGYASTVERPSFQAREAIAALWHAKWEVLLPLVVLGSLFSGIGAVESAAIAACYALVVQRFVHRDLASGREVIRVVGDAVALIGGVLLIIAAAIGVTDYLVAAAVPSRLVEWTATHVESRLLFLLVLNVFLLGVGALMDIFSAIIVVVPLIVPLAEHFGIDPVHLGIIFIANLELGYLTPPVGLNLFLSSYRFKTSVMEVARATLPLLVILAIGVLLITYVPWLTLGALEWLGRR